MSWFWTCMSWLGATLLLVLFGYVLYWENARDEECLARGGVPFSSYRASFLCLDKSLLK